MNQVYFESLKGLKKYKLTSCYLLVALISRLRGLGASVARSMGLPVTPKLEEDWQEMVDRDFLAPLQREVFVKE